MTRQAEFDLGLQFFENAGRLENILMVSESYFEQQLGKLVSEMGAEMIERPRLQLRPNDGSRGTRRGKLDKWRVRHGWNLVFLENKKKHGPKRDLMGWLTVKVGIGTEGHKGLDQERNKVYFMVYIIDNPNRAVTKRIGHLVGQLKNEHPGQFDGSGICEPVHFNEGGKSRVMLYSERLENTWDGPAKLMRLQNIWRDLLSLESELEARWLGKGDCR